MGQTRTLGMGTNRSLIQDGGRSLRCLGKKSRNFMFSFWGEREFAIQLSRSIAHLIMKPEMGRSDELRVEPDWRCLEKKADYQPLCVINWRKLDKHCQCDCNRHSYGLISVFITTDWKPELPKNIEQVNNTTGSNLVLNEFKCNMNMRTMSFHWPER